MAAAANWASFIVSQVVWIIHKCAYSWPTNLINVQWANFSYLIMILSIFLHGSEKNLVGVLRGLTNQPYVRKSTCDTPLQPPACHIWHCLHVFTSALNPCSTVPPYYTPLLSHSAPSAYQQPHLLNQRTLLLILTNPAPQQKSFFWVVRNTQCGLIIWFRQVLGFHISEWHI